MAEKNIYSAQCTCMDLSIRLLLSEMWNFHYEYEPIVKLSRYTAL